MASTAAATAIIQFIGIVVFSRDLSPDHHLQALMPRISSEAPFARAAVSIESPAPAAASVESHTALIAFATCDYVSSMGWPPSGMEAVRGLLFVRLDGERITLIPSKDKIASGIPANANPLRQAQSPTFATELKPTELQLPHLQKTCCPAMKALKPQFQPPDFSGAAAVIDILYGEATACGANASGVNRNRVDTRITIENDGYLTISAKKGGKTKKIVLNGNAKIYVANLPSEFLEPGDHLHLASAPHYMAYFQMGEGTNSCSTFECAKGHPEIPQCAPSAIRERIVTDPVALAEGQSSSILDFARVDFECSNSLWP